MRELLIIGVFSSLMAVANMAFATDLACEVYPKAGGVVSGNGTSSCDAIDFSFGNSTSGRFYLSNISKPINQIIWQDDASCSGGTSCGVTVRAYTTTSASALILYKDGTYETTNAASIYYETGF